MISKRSETGIGGVKTYRTLEGGGTRPESCPWKAWTFDPQIGDFLWNLCRKGLNFGRPWKFEIFTPPRIFGDLTPPIPVSKRNGMNRHPNMTYPETFIWRCSHAGTTFSEHHRSRFRDGDSSQPKPPPQGNLEDRHCKQGCWAPPHLKLPHSRKIQTSEGNFAETFAEILRENCGTLRK